jgi:hypothetical protein
MSPKPPSVYKSLSSDMHGKSCVLPFCHCDKKLEKRFIVDHGFRDFSPWLAGSFAMGL